MGRLIISEHALDRWRERVDGRDRNAARAEIVAGLTDRSRWLRSLHADDGTAYVRVELPAGSSRAWWAARLALDPERDAIVVATVTAGHVPSRNRPENTRQQLRRRCWRRWVAWCAARDVSPIGAADAWRAWLDGNDEPNNVRKEMPTVVRGVHRAAGWDAATIDAMFPRRAA